MRLIKKYNQKKKIKNLIYKDFEKAIEAKDYFRSGILSKRFLKLDQK